MTEQWRTVAGFEAYEVSDLGRVRSVSRMVPNNRWPGAPMRVWKGRPIVTSMDSKKKYCIATLNVKGKTVTRLLHRLVATAFIPNPLNLPQVNHKDGKKKNCKATNLEWRTCLGNHRHALKLGLAGDSIFFDKRWGKWNASYSPEPYTVKYLGAFNTRAEALAVRRAAVEALPYVL